MEFYSTKQVSLLLNIAIKNVIVKANNENWKSKPRQGRGGGFIWIFESMPEKTQNSIRMAELKNIPAICEVSEVQTEESETLSANKKENALFKADLLRLYAEFQEIHGKTVSSKEKFIELYNNRAYPEIFSQLGEVSWKTLERWKNKQIKSHDYLSLTDKRGLA